MQPMSVEPLAIKLDRPLAIFDIESTGISPRADRIIQLDVMDQTGWNGNREVWLVNPTIPSLSRARRCTDHGRVVNTARPCAVAPQVDAS